MGTKQVNNSPEIRSDIKLIERYIRPSLNQMSIQIPIGLINEPKVAKIFKEDLNRRMQPHLKIAKQRQIANNTDRLLQIRPGKFLVTLPVLLRDLDLLEVTDPEEHPLLALDGGLEVEEVVVLVLVVGGVRH